MESDFNKIYEINQHACELTSIENLEKVWKYSINPFYTTLTNFSTKYLVMCNVYTGVGGIK